MTSRRAAAAIAGHRGDGTRARAALADPDGSVRAAAYGALVRLGACGPSDVTRAIRDPDPGVRRTICELAGRIGRGPFARLLDDDVPEVIEAAAFATGEIADRRAVPRLVVLATSHPDALVRESAVAALGAIGDVRGKPAVLAALGDAAYIRRRAVAALAAFTGPDVDAALLACGTDRDWQVRQAAEDVIGAARPPVS